MSALQEFLEKRIGITAQDAADLWERLAAFFNEWDEVYADFRARKAQGQAPTAPSPPLSPPGGNVP